MKITSIKLFVLGAILTLNTSFMPHPVHLTVAEAHWKKDRKALEISVKLFFNDFEASLSEQQGKAIYLCPDSTNAHYAQVEQYFKRNFKLTVNDKKKQFKLLGYECENELTYVYLEYTGINKIKNVTVENRLLFDGFSDQTNLMHLHMNGGSHTLLAQPKTPVAHLDL